MPKFTFVNAMVEMVLDDVAPLKVTDQVAPAGRPLCVKVTVYAIGAKLAVTVPGALIDAVVDALVVDPKIMEVVDELQEPKV